MAKRFKVNIIGEGKFALIRVDDMWHDRRWSFKTRKHAREFASEMNEMSDLHLTDDETANKLQKQIEGE